MAACQANCTEARDLALEASPLYVPLAELAREGFTGTVAELHTRLDSMVSDAMRPRCAGPRRPTAWVMRSGAWPPISAPRESSFSSAATMCRADAWSPWSLLRRVGKHRQLLSVAVSNRAPRQPLEPIAFPSATDDH